MPTPPPPDDQSTRPKFVLPEPCLVLLVGPSGAGKSTFARRFFRPTEILSSDYFRGLVCDDEGSQAASHDAFEVLYLLAGKRLARGRLTVIDATNLQKDARKPLLDLARRYHVDAVAIVFELPQEVCQQYNQQRPQRIVESEVVAGHWLLLRQALSALNKERFRDVFVLRSAEEVATARIERRPLEVNRKGEHGPFDVIGDVHGCFDELSALLQRLGYEVRPWPDLDGGIGSCVVPPQGRKAIFVGDLVDRGPKVAAVLRLAMGMVEAGTALCVRGNHDDKLLRKLHGREVKVTYGLAQSLQQLEREPPDFSACVRTFLEGLPTHYVLDGGRLVVAHAGLKEEMHGRVSGAVRSFTLYGDTTGAVDEFGMPVRLNWAADYQGRAIVVYGHTPVPEAEWLNGTINIDTGCVFGGKLTALRYPENELVSVPAGQEYSRPGRPFLPAQGSDADPEPT